MISLFCVVVMDAVLFVILLSSVVSLALISVIDAVCDVNNNSFVVRDPRRLVILISSAVSRVLIPEIELVCPVITISSAF